MTEPCFINHLPSEVLDHVMSFLEPKDLAQTELVSKKWQEASNCEILWRRHCETKYGTNYLSSVGYPHPKSAWLLPIYIKSFHHVLKTLPLEIPDDSSLQLELHGQYLIQRDKIKVKDPCSKISICTLIYDLIRQEQIAIPKFFDEASFIKWTVCNKKQAVVVQDKEGRLIYSEPPFDTQISYDSFDGSVLNVVGKLIFYTSKDKKLLSVFNLNEGKTTFTMSMNSPIQSFFASEQAHVAILEDRLLIFNEPSDLSKNIEVYLKGDERYKVLSNKNWLLVVSEKYNGIFFHAYSFATEKLHTDLSLPIQIRQYDYDYGRYCKLECNGLELCNNYLFVNYDLINVFDLGALNQEKRSFEKMELDYCFHIIQLSSFEEQLLFFYIDGWGQLYFTDVATNPINQKMDLEDLEEDTYPQFHTNGRYGTKLRNQKMDLEDLEGNTYPQVVTNGRFIVFNQRYGKDAEIGKKVKYCDFLAPERSSSKHFISLNDKRVHKKIKN